MLHLKKIIEQLSEDDYKAFSFRLIESKGGKFFQLLEMMKKDDMEEEEIFRQLEIGPSAFYALKSRLHEKLQEFLAAKMPDMDTDLLKKIRNIPDIIYSASRETAVAILQKMEKEIEPLDIPFAMASVYQALKMVHKYSPKYYEYSQKYNKQIAYAVTMHKVEELLADFIKTLGEYLLSKDKKYLELLQVIRREMQNHAHLYESHHLQVYENILKIFFAMYLPRVGNPDQQDDEQAEDDIITETEKILKTFSKEPLYRHLQVVIDFFWFEYYFRHGISKKAEKYYEIINERLPVFLQNNFSCFPSLFLISKIYYHLQKGNEKELWNESKKLFEKFTPDSNDASDYINCTLFHSISAFYAEKYNEAVSLLNKLVNKVSFLPFLHAEIEVKLFLVSCYSMVNKYEVGYNLLKNIQRKLRDLKRADYEHAMIFSKILALQMDSSDKGRFAKMQTLRDKFLSLNKGELKMLEFVKMDDGFLKQLAKQVK